MSEDWHYITYGNGVEELYDLKNDQMEWNNLIRSESTDVKNALEYLTAYLPESYVDPIPKSVKDKSLKEVDKTIKPKRNLNRLK